MGLTYRFQFWRAGSIPNASPILARIEICTSDPGFPNHIDLNLSIETPENVRLTWQLAGPAVRLAAYLMDLLIRVAIVFAAAIVLGCAGMAFPGFSAGLLLVTFFVIEWGYFVISEAFFRGKTIGKHLFGLRVIQEGGYPLTFWSALLRNLARAADGFPFFFYGIGFLTMLVAGDFRRLGDLVARTLVIEERAVRLPMEPVILEKIQPLARSEISGYSPPAHTLALIEQFLGRRHALTHRRGHDMALALARTLSQCLSYQGDVKLVEQYPMAFLARVFATFHRPDEPDDDVGARSP